MNSTLSIKRFFSRFGAVVLMCASFTMVFIKPVAAQTLNKQQQADMAALKNTTLNSDLS